MSSTDITIEVGETKIIKINLAPEEYKESYIVYPNNYDQSLISLKITKISSQSGIIEITGLASGDTALCFKAIDLATNAEFKATANVHSIVSQTGIAFAEKEVNLNIEETNVYQTRILRVPDNATSYNYDSIEFKSSDENIASVDSNGLVICKNIGKATISAKTNDDKFQASFEITVNAYPVLEFKSKNPFTIKSGWTKSDGTPGRAWNDLNYSGVFPSSTWQSWVGEEISAVLNSFDNCYYLYLRGSNNTRICRDQKDGLSYSGSNDEYIFGGWKIKGEDVYCSGDIRALLKYKDVENSVVGTCCFAQLFLGNRCLKSAPDLPSINIPKEDIIARTTGSIYCYAEMFYGTGIEIAPALPALELPSNCYDGMFAYSSLKYAPALPALSVPHGGYRCMFQGCEYLETVPALVATSSQLASYEDMFQLCPLLKFSTSYDEENGYVNEFKFNKVVSRENMGTFENTGGAFTGDPSTNLILYTSNEIVYPETELQDD